MTSSRPMLERSMPHYAALDVSNEETAIHVVDDAGRTVWRGKRASDPSPRHGSAPSRTRPGAGWTGDRLPDSLAVSQPQGSRPAGRLPGGPPCPGCDDTPAQQDRCEG